jgi:DNA-directed RNA polymerase subunit RPC12/RpoP
MKPSEKKMIDAAKCFDCKRKAVVVFLPNRTGVRLDCPHCGFWLEYKTKKGNYRPGPRLNKTHAFVRAITWKEHEKYIKNLEEK